MLSIKGIKSKLVGLVEKTQDPMVAAGGRRIRALQPVMDGTQQREGESLLLNRFFRKTTTESTQFYGLRVASVRLLAFTGAAEVGATLSGSSVAEHHVLHGAQVRFLPGFHALAALVGSSSFSDT